MMLISSYKTYLPRTLSDLISFIFLLSAVIAVFIFEVTVVVPYVHPFNAAIQYFHTIAGTFIIHNIIGNFILLITTETSTKSVVLPSTLKSGWRFCTSCEANAPPRSFHCQVCNICILRRDHHCVFAGKCVGYRNIRYFFGLLVHLTLGGFYASMLNIFFIWDALGGFTVRNAIAHIFPFLFWLFGSLDSKITFWTMLSVLSTCGGLFTLSLIFYHGSLLIKNQTTYEKNRGINNYNLEDWLLNAKECLGECWTFIFISPFIPSKLPRNGMDFPTRSEYRLRSNKYK